jgi:hypothetical protein
LEHSAKTPWHLWVIGLLATLWNAGGAYDYTMTQTRNMDYLTTAAEGAGVSVDVMIDYYGGFPALFDALWALGVWGALAGSVLLLLRSRFAFHAFVISILGLVGTTVYTVTSDMPDELASPMMWVFTAAIWLSVILLAWYSKRMTAAGVLK